MNITLHDKTLDIRITAAAERALLRRTTPLIAEMELLFSCLLRKRVLFSEGGDPATPVNEYLAVRFRPIMTRRCSVSDAAGAPPSDNFVLENPRPFVPGWLSIDYRRGEWLGKFGYAE